MSSSWFWLLLAIIAQLLMALENYIDRYLLVRYKAHREEHTGAGTLVLVSAFFAILFSGVVGAVAVLLSLFDFISAGPLALSGSERVMALSVGVLEIAWLVPYLYALNLSDETQTVPLFQIVPVFGLVLGLMFFGEVPTLLHVVAAGVILGGSVLLNTNWHEKRGNSGKVRMDMRVVLLMTLASLIIAVAAFLFKGAALEDNFWGTAAWMYLGSFFTGCFIWAVVPKYRREFVAFVERRDVKGFTLNAINEVIDNVSLLVFYGAVVLGPSVALVQSTFAYQPLFVLGIAVVAARFGSRFHAERLSGRGLFHRTVGIAAIVFGSVLIFV